MSEKKSGKRNSKRGKAAKEMISKRKVPRGGGVVVEEDGTSYILTPVDSKTLAITANELARLIHEHTEERDKFLGVAREHREKLLGLTDRINELAAEVESGVRRTPRQAELPGATDVNNEEPADVTSGGGASA